MQIQEDTFKLPNESGEIHKEWFVEAIENTTELDFAESSSDGA